MARIKTTFLDFILCAIIFTHSITLSISQDLSQNPIIASENITQCSPSPPSNPLPTGPLVPAFFILGDSTVDCGTNNFLFTFARADRDPYGRDFDTHQPTGRFSNGRIPVDYLASQLGLPLIPSYLGQLGAVEDMIHGVNYASAGAGIICSSGSELVFILNLGEDAAADLISRSVFYISIGVNDYIHYYLRNISHVQNLYLPWSFRQFLASSMKHELRKIVVMGLAPIGCAPYYLWRYNSTNGDCIKQINDTVQEFNFFTRYMIQELSQELPDAKIIFCDLYEGSMYIIKNHELHGFSETTDACCGLGKYKGWIMCLTPEMACRNASSHIWWDQYHPTDAVNAILADNVWSGLHTKMCYPMDMRDIIT